MAEQKSDQDVWPKRDDVGDEDGPRRSQDVGKDHAQDARRHDRQSKDVDPDSAESSVDRDDRTGDGA
jgi:hypothetical protein